MTDELEAAASLLRKSKRRYRNTAIYLWSSAHQCIYNSFGKAHDIDYIFRLRSHSTFANPNGINMLHQLLAHLRSQLGYLITSLCAFLSSRLRI